MDLRQLFSVSLISVALAGCGGDDEGGSTTATVDQTQAALSARNVIDAARVAMDSDDGPGAALELAGAAAGMAAIAIPEGSEDGYRYGERRNAPTECASGTADCTETSCTFTGCSNGSVSIDGSFSWDGGHLLCDFSISMDFGDLAFSITETCDLMVTETSIDGDLSVDMQIEGSVQGQSTDADIMVDMTYDQVMFDTTGCPTGGSVSVSVEASGTENGRSSNYSASGSVSFDGTGC